jgi:hypothetical protein
VLIIIRIIAKIVIIIIIIVIINLNFFISLCSSFYTLIDTDVISARDQTHN